jgi:methylated-DNA-[protein]-cysteine S-methyltransferase
LILLLPDLCIFEKKDVENCIGYYSSPIGIIEITADDNSITGVIFSKRDDKKTEIKTNHQYENPLIKKCISQLDEYFEGSREIFDLPITHTGTEFQKNVWKQLNEIPYGKTISYLSLSKNIGNVKAIRAVGAANGKNKISIIVPCHRVIGSSGEMIGYGGDVWRK